MGSYTGVELLLLVAAGLVLGNEGEFVENADIKDEKTYTSAILAGC